MTAAHKRHFIVLKATKCNSSSNTTYPLSGHFLSRIPMDAAKKAFTKLTYSNSNIVCANISIQEVGKQRIFQYKISRTLLKKPIVRFAGQKKEFIIRYNVEAKAMKQNKKVSKTKKSQKERTNHHDKILNRLHSLGRRRKLQQKNNKNATEKRILKNAKQLQTSMKALQTNNASKVRKKVRNMICNDKNRKKIPESEWITPSNIIYTKRKRRPKERYMDPEYADLMLDDIPPEEFRAAVLSDVSEDEEIEKYVESEWSDNYDSEDEYDFDEHDDELDEY